jgi:hypothetical protein
MKYYTSFMHNINTGVFYTLPRSVLIISNKWSTDHMWNWSIIKIAFNSIDVKLPQIYICDWYNSKHIFRSHCYEISIHISIFIKEFE